MVALDQRESLREMFPTASDGQLVGDNALRSFKQTASQVLSPFASGVLLDHPLGVGRHRPSGVAGSCGLVLAADVLHAVCGEGVQASTLDPAVDLELIAETGAAAIKYLVIWRRHDRSWKPSLQAFLALAESAGVASFVEGIVRPESAGSWSSVEDRHAAILEAAADLSPGASVYKAEVPGYRPGDLESVREQSQHMSEVATGPWVVLSNGIRQPDFAEAVTVACAGGASGFLAGRAIWADTVSHPNPVEALRSRSIGRLQLLSGIVERRPQQFADEGCTP